MNETLTAFDGFVLIAPLLIVCLIFIVGHEIWRLSNE
jgi:hypothetical protein